VETGYICVLFYRTDGWSSVAEAVGKAHSSQKWTFYQGIIHYLQF